MLDRHQILDTVLGELQDITLARVVLGVGTLIRCAVVILHRELTTTITNAEHSASTFLESIRSLWSTLGLPYVQLRNPINL